MEPEKMCRVCLLQEDKVRLLDWCQTIDSIDDVLTYKECFCKCTQINLTLRKQDDARTQFLCISCAEKLTDVYEFIEKAKRSDNELRSMEVDSISEWVSVNVKDEEKDNILKNLDGVKLISEWSDASVDETIRKTSNKIVQEDITDENLKKERNREDEENASITSNDLVNEFDGDFVDEAAKVFSNENSSTKGSPRKKFQTKNGKKSTKRIKNKLKSDKSEDDPVSCEICSKIMRRSYLRHHKQCHKPKALLCKACPRTFNVLGSLKKHELTHEQKRERFPCDKCHQTLSSPYALKSHMLTHDNNRKPQYKCTQCEKSFLNKNGLKTHELHHKGAQFECKICQKRYVRQIDLDAHWRTHSAESPFVCSLCGRSFMHKKGLNKHMQEHSGLFRYTCQTCGEEFSKYDIYRKHRMKHTGFPYKCGVCEKPFPDTYKMKRHITGVHKIDQDDEVKKLMVKVIDTKEYRGRIIEVLKDPDDIVNQNDA